MNIKSFLKPGEDMVIEIEGVEYLVDDSAVAAIEKKDTQIDLIQLYDRQHYQFAADTITESLEKNGVVDYLPKQKVIE